MMQRIDHRKACCPQWINAKIAQAQDGATMRGTIDYMSYVGHSIPRDLLHVV
jgi:hypothetical protein